MKIHEYQARALLSDAGIPVPPGCMIETVDAAVKEQPESYLWMHKRFKTRPEGNPESLYKSL